MTAPGPDSLPFRMSRLQWMVRVVGGLLLTAAAVMLVLGLTAWADRLAGAQFVVYWSWCFLVASAAILVAVVDVVLLQRAYNRTRQELFHREFKAARPTPPPDKRPQPPR